MKTLKISTETIIRTIVLALALINQLLTATGHAVINIDEGTVTQLVTTAITVAAALWAWWKNNSFTQDALQADQTLNALRAGEHDNEGGAKE